MGWLPDYQPGLLRSTVPYSSITRQLRRDRLITAAAAVMVAALCGRWIG